MEKWVARWFCELLSKFGVQQRLYWDSRLRLTGVRTYGVVAGTTLSQWPLWDCSSSVCGSSSACHLIPGPLICREQIKPEPQVLGEFLDSASGDVSFGLWPQQLEPNILCAENESVPLGLLSWSEQDTVAIWGQPCLPLIRITQNTQDRALWGLPCQTNEWEEWKPCFQTWRE